MIMVQCIWLVNNSALLKTVLVVVTKAIGFPVDSLVHQMNQVVKDVYSYTLNC